MLIPSPHPVAKAAWDTACAAFRAEFPDTIPALGHVSDLAREAFYIRTEGKEEDPRFATEAPIAARLMLLDFVIKWGKPARRK